jgi:hypothetical protein
MARLPGSAPTRCVKFGGAMFPRGEFGLGPKTQTARDGWAWQARPERFELPTFGSVGRADENDDQRPEATDRP